MHGGMARQSLQPSAHVDQVMNLFVLLIKGLQLRVHLQCPVYGNTLILLIGNHFCNPVHIGIGQIHHPPYVADHTLGRHCTEGDDLHHLIAAVFPAHIVNYLLPSLIAEVHVDIRHGNTLRV